MAFISVCEWKKFDKQVNKLKRGRGERMTSFSSEKFNFSLDHTRQRVSGVFVFVFVRLLSFFVCVCVCMHVHLWESLCEGLLSVLSLKRSSLNMQALEKYFSLFSFCFILTLHIFFSQTFIFYCTYTCMRVLWICILCKQVSLTKPLRGRIILGELSENQSP